MAFAALLLLLPLFCGVHGHMEITQPLPLRSKFDPRTPENLRDYSMTSPLAGDGSNYACKGTSPSSLRGRGEFDRSHRLRYAVCYCEWLDDSYAHGWSAGVSEHALYCEDKILMCAHSSRSACQGRRRTRAAQVNFRSHTTAAIPSSSWRPSSVACLFHLATVRSSSLSKKPMSFARTAFTVPVDVPASSKALLSWTWFNKVGNREMYQNCAVRCVAHNVNVAEGSAQLVQISNSRSTTWTAPLAYRANTFANGQCITREGEEIVFPNPGPQVQVRLSFCFFSFSSSTQRLAVR